MPPNGHDDAGLDTSVNDHGCPLFCVVACITRPAGWPIDASTERYHHRRRSLSTTEKTMNDKSTAERSAAGLKTRREVLGPAYVDKAVASTDDFNRDFQQLLNTYC